MQTHIPTPRPPVLEIIVKTCGTEKLMGQSVEQKSYEKAYEYGEVCAGEPPERERRGHSQAQNIQEKAHINLEADFRHFYNLLHLG